MSGVHTPRITPLGLVPKHKWDPLCDKFRIVSDFSHRDSSSINSLSYSPKLISFHVQPWHIRDICSFLGPRFQFFAIDVVNAFRNNTTRVSDLHLFVYQLVHNKFYVDLRHCFGHTVSEWSFATITAVLRNAMLSELGTSTDSSFTLAFVDNWWILSRFGDETHLHRCERLKFYLRSAGLALHEEQTGSVVTALGWEWHRDGFFTRQQSKCDVVRSYLLSWCIRARKLLPISSADVERVTGLLYWMTTGMHPRSPPLDSCHSLVCSGRLASAPNIQRTSLLLVVCAMGILLLLG